MTDLTRLSRADRLRLMKFVAVAVWSDLEVGRSEKSFLLGLALRLGVPDDEIEQIEEWLERPPPPEEVDPALVPAEHRALFLEAVRGAMSADHELDPPERETLRLLEELLG